MTTTITLIKTISHFNGDKSEQTSTMDVTPEIYSLIELYEADMAKRDAAWQTMKTTYVEQYNAWLGKGRKSAKRDRLHKEFNTIFDTLYSHVEGNKIAEKLKAAFLAEYNMKISTGIFKDMFVQVTTNLAYKAAYTQCAYTE